MRERVRIKKQVGSKVMGEFMVKTFIFIFLL